ncbi:MAG: hypothetical protein Q8P44_06190 [Dehalococcoidia bacterium]|nr:hypothetical protein [Dehalococcoidia bacterium]
MVKGVSPPTSAPSHTSPSSGATGVSTSPTLQWQAVSGATKYGLYVSKPPYGEANLVYQNEAVTGTSQTLSITLEGGVIYRWNMRAGNDAGWGPLSSPWSFTTAQAPVTLTLYVHENSASGPIISGAQVTGQDGAGASFSQVTNSSGYVSISGTAGTWSFTASKSGFNTNSWSQSITATDTKHAYMVKQLVLPQISGVSPSQPKVQATRQWISILGSGFVSQSEVTLRIGGSTYVIPADRTQFINSGQINVYVGLTETGTWSAQVTNPGGSQSNILSFQVVP